MADDPNANQNAAQVPPIVPAPIAAPVHVQHQAHAVAMAPVTILVTMPNIRNGAIQDIVPASPREHIPRSYRWTHIAGLPNEEALHFVNYITKATFVTMCDGAFQQMQEPERILLREKSIVLSGIRAGVASSYQLGPNDLQASEMAGAIKSAASANGQWHLEDAPQTAAAGTSAWNGCADLTDDEVAMVSTLAYMAIGIPVLQGLSLIKFGHHYLSNAGENPKRPWIAMMKQVKSAANVFTQNYMEKEWFQDVAFHKACHPMNPAIKQTLAKSLTVKNNIKAAGLGSAAVRLPATMPELEVAKMSVAILREANSTLIGLNKHVDMTRLEELIGLAMAAAAGQAEVNAVAAAVHCAEANAEITAYACGIVRRIHESSRPSTLLNAYSAKRVIVEHSASEDDGYRARGAYSAALANRLAAGEFQEQRFVFT